MNEVYKKEPLLAPTQEDTLRCPGNSCSKSGTQCVNVSKPVVLTPTATVGTPTVSCQGTPTVVCETNAAETACTVTLTQNVCVTIPVQYGVSMTEGEPSINCGGDASSC